jgi:hypothetical protein
LERSISDLVSRFFPLSFPLFIVWGTFVLEYTFEYQTKIW